MEIVNYNRTYGRNGAMSHSNQQGSHTSGMFVLMCRQHADSLPNKNRSTGTQCLCRWCMQRLHEGGRVEVMRIVQLKDKQWTSSCYYSIARI